MISYLTEACVYVQDKETAADYYFDSYAHFGEFSVIIAESSAFCNSHPRWSHIPFNQSKFNLSIVPQESMKRC